MYQTMPAKAKLLPEGTGLPERDPPVRYRKVIPTSWIELTLIEGKNRQVRKMCAKTGFPVLRLVRTRIENLLLSGMKSGDVKETEGKDLRELLWSVKKKYSDRSVDWGCGLSCRLRFYLPYTSCKLNR